MNRKLKCKIVKRWKGEKTMRESCCEVDPRDEKMEKMRIENAEMFQHVRRLEEELEKERAYLKALVTIINNADFIHT